MVLAACDYLAGLNTACSRTYRQFRPLIEARVQAELYELLLRCFEASPADGRSANAEITATVVSWAIFDAGLRWSQGGEPGTVEEYAARILACPAPYQARGRDQAALRARTVASRPEPVNGGSTPADSTGKRDAAFNTWKTPTTQVENALLATHPGKRPRTGPELPSTPLCAFCRYLRKVSRFDVPRALQSVASDVSSCQSVGAKLNRHN